MCKGELMAMIFKLSADIWAVIIISLLIVCISMLPTGFSVNEYFGESSRASVLILDTGNQNLYNTGVIQQGEQTCTVRILDGPFKGQETTGVNHLMGKLEMDKIFVPGDKALVSIDFDGDQINFVTLIDHYRINMEILLFLAFAILLVGFARTIGLKTILSFIFTIVVIWKLLVPGLLKGLPPIGLSLVIVVMLTVTIITLVLGFNRQATAAIIGSLLGSFLTCVLAIIFGNLFKIHGAVMDFSESLLYSGYSHLNLTEIFIAATFIASSGAVMDIAVDMVAAMYELIQKKPEMSSKEIIRSGFNIGRAVIGTMTTTLLLAYSGGYIGLLMVFTAQGTPVINILNLKYVAAEIFYTLVGSFGLVTVAPFTAIIAGLLFTRPGFVKRLRLENEQTLGV